MQDNQFAQHFKHFSTTTATFHVTYRCIKPLHTALIFKAVPSTQKAANVMPPFVLSAILVYLSLHSRLIFALKI
ncbi:MAG: hypothetical protein IK092_01545, partial [Muribaculaceae bacterium]|nr:hypothetical protein [Muribaculaceae bacterium]